MSLLDALNVAASSLRTTQASISVVSQNVANAQNPNYAERTAVVAEVAYAGGVDITGINRATDQALQQQLLTQNAQAAGDSAVSSLYQQLENVTGGSQGTPTLSSAASQLQTAWQTYEATPEDTSAQQALLQAGTSLGQALSSTASGVEQLATTAQGNVGTDVQTLNGDLAQIDQLNKQIVTAQATGTPVPDLEDQRDAAISSLSKLVGVQTVPRSDGSVYLFTPNGLTLVGATAESFSWDGTNITQTGSATSLNTSFQNGSIGATLNFLRTDNTAVNSGNPSLGALQKMRDQLDSYAASFYDTTASPAPSFEAAYDNATPVQAGEQASAFFTTSDGAATANRFDLVVNPSLINGTTQIKQSAGTPVVAALTQTNQSLNAGGLAVTGQTYAQVANAIVSTVSTNAGAASTTATTSTATSSALQTQLSGKTGVNVDNEMSNLIVLQNSYAAAARVMTTISSMLTTLMSIGQG